MQTNRGKQQNGKDQASLQENWRHQRNISCTDGTIKDRNGKDLTEAEYIKKRWQECTEELQKKGLNGPDNHDGVTHLELDILECEVKWVLGSVTMNKASGGDGIPAELFKILKDDAVKVMHSICQRIGELSSGHRTGRAQFSFQSQRKAMPENVQTTNNCTHFTCQQGNDQNPLIQASTVRELRTSRCTRQKYQRLN